jgi:hypothetical protein
MAKELLGIASGAESESVKLAAIRDALDRAGVSAKQALELSTARQPEPWELLLADIAFDGIANITREESRARRGLANGASTAEVVVDAELVVEPDDRNGLERRDHSPADELRGPVPVDLPREVLPAATGRRETPPVTVSYEDAPAVMRAAIARTSRVRPKRQARRLGR